MASSEASPGPPELEMRAAKEAEQQAEEDGASGWSCRRPPVRLAVLLLTTGGFMVQMMLRVTVSVAIVAMVNYTAIPHTEISASDACVNRSSSDAPPPPKEEDREEGEYAWTESTQGLILAAFYWGYFITQIPGGYLADRYGSKRVLGASQAANGFLALVLPSAAASGAFWVGFVRFMQGLVCGPVYPCLFPLVARWFPPIERQRVFGFVNALTAFAIAATSTSAGQLSAALGWRAVFYTAGSIALVWSAAWMLIVHDTPEEHPATSAAEKRHIGEGNVTVARISGKPPLLAMLRSPPVIAIVISETSNSWALTYLMTSLPTYMKHVLGFDLKANGALSGLPLMFRGLTMLVAGAAADLALRKRWLSVHVIRRVAAGLTSGGGALLLFLITFVGCQPAVATLFVCLAGLLNGFVTTGALMNPLDISHNYSGTVFAIANFFGNGISTLNPVATGKMIDGEQTAERWNNVFYLGAGIFAVSLILYQAMMSTERQPWDMLEDEVKGKDDTGNSTKEETSETPGGEQHKDE